MDIVGETGSDDPVSVQFENWGFTEPGLVNDIPGQSFHAGVSYSELKFACAWSLSQKFFWILHSLGGRPLENVWMNQEVIFLDIGLSVIKGNL